MKTKPVHYSFSEISSYSQIDRYGLISYDIEPNREFIGRILTFGPDLEVIEPIALRKEMKKKTECLARIYASVPQTKKKVNHDDV